MSTVTTTQNSKEKLAALRKERARISNEIAKLTQKYSENEKKAGYVYYMHSKYEPVAEGEMPIPRVSIAAYVDHARKELCYGLRVWPKGFNRKIGRHKALGKALSVRHRKIARLSSTDTDSVRDKMFDVLDAAQLTAMQNIAKKNAKPATTSVRVKATELVTKQLATNGTY